MFATTATGSIRGGGIVVNIGGSCSAITSLLSSNDSHYQWQLLTSRTYRERIKGHATRFWTKSRIEKLHA